MKEQNKTMIKALMIMAKTVGATPCYVVTLGDTISEIAEAAGIQDWRRFAGNNGVWEPKLLMCGTKLILDHQAYTQGGPLLTVNADDKLFSDLFFQSALVINAQQEELIEALMGREEHDRLRAVMQDFASDLYQLSGIGNVTFTARDLREWVKIMRNKIVNRNPEEPSQRMTRKQLMRSIIKDFARKVNEVDRQWVPIPDAKDFIVRLMAAMDMPVDTPATPPPKPYNIDSDGFTCDCIPKVDGIYQTKIWNKSGTPDVGYSKWAQGRWGLQMETMKDANAIWMFVDDKNQTRRWKELS